MLQQMKMRTGFFLAVFILFSVEVSRGQQIDSTRENGGIAQKMYAGVLKCLAWYDVPLAVADLAQLAFIPANATGKPIEFPPTAFDTRFQPHVGVHGSQTFVGQVGEAGAAAFLGLRLLVNAGSDLAGGNVTTEDYNRTFWFYKSIVYTYSITTLTKNLVYRMRPDGSDSQSFFSGHSSTAFCAASYLSLELDDWYDRWETTRSNDALRSTFKIGSDIALYAGATYVAYARMHDEKHYFSDVAVGAVVGTVVGTLMYHWHWGHDSSVNQDVSFMIVDRTPMMSYTLRF
jgi:membrane-associated phospholipid phosphatase